MPLFLTIFFAVVRVGYFVCSLPRETKGKIDAFFERGRKKPGPKTHEADVEEGPE